MMFISIVAFVIILNAVNIGYVLGSTVPRRNPRPAAAFDPFAGELGEPCTGNVCEEAHFNYNGSSCFGPDSWHEVADCWSKCQSTTMSTQSPVGLDSQRSVFVPLPALVLRNCQRRIPAKVYNNGHSPPFQARIPQVFIQNPPGRSGTYIFRQFHVHVGASSNVGMGSEHSINDRFYPMEVHSIFYNSKYSPDEASSYPDGLVVLGTMVKVNGISSPNNGNQGSYRCNPKFATNLDFLLRKYSPLVTQYTTPVENEADIVEGISPLDVMPHSDSSGFPSFRTYYTYEGSLTTPPCDESLRWFVMSCPITVSLEAYRAYANIMDSDIEPLHIFGIRRPIQRQLGSEALKSFPGHFE